MKIRDVPTTVVLPEGSTAVRIEEGEVEKTPFGTIGAVGQEAITHPYFGGFDRA